jgi:hypothetical protein
MKINHNFTLIFYVKTTKSIEKKQIVYGHLHEFMVC